MSISALARRRVLIRAAITSIVTAGALLIAWRLLGKSVAWQGVHPTPIAVLLAALGAAAFLAGRAWRFGLLLPRRRGSRSELLGVAGTSWGAGLLLPGPSADVTFVALSRGRLGVGVVRASGAAILARVLDVVSLAAVAVLSGAITATAQPRAVVITISAAALLGVAALAGLIIPGPRGLALRAAGRIPRLAAIAERGEAAIHELNSPRRWLGLIAATLSCRVATAVQYAALISMVGIHLGFWQTWFVLSIRTLLLTIPIQGIAGIGTGQAWWAGALLLEGISPAVAVASGITLQAIDLAVSLPIAGIAGARLLRGRHEPTVEPDGDDAVIEVKAAGAPQPREASGIALG